MQVLLFSLVPSGQIIDVVGGTVSDLNVEGETVVDGDVDLWALVAVEDNEVDGDSVSFTNDVIKIVLPAMKALEMCISVMFAPSK